MDLFKKIGRTIKQIATGVAYQAVPGGKTYADAQREEERRRRQQEAARRAAEQAARQRQIQAQRQQQQSTIKVGVAKPQTTIDISKPRQPQATIKLAPPTPTPSVQVKDMGARILPPKPQTQVKSVQPDVRGMLESAAKKTPALKPTETHQGPSHVPQKIRDVAVDVARETIKGALQRPGASLRESQRNTAAGKLEKDLQDFKAKPYEERRSLMRSNPNIATTLEQYGITDPTDEQLVKLSKKATKARKSAENDAYKPTGVEAKVVGKEPVKSYQQLRRGYQQSLESGESVLNIGGEKGQKFGKEFAAPLSFVGIGLTGATDLPGVNPSKNVAKKLVKAKTEDAVKRVLEKEGLQASQNTVKKLAATESEDVVQQMLAKAKPVQTKLDLAEPSVKVAEESAQDRLKRQRDELTDTLSKPLSERKQRVATTSQSPAPLGLVETPSGISDLPGPLPKIEPIKVADEGPKQRGFQRNLIKNEKDSLVPTPQSVIESIPGYKPITNRQTFDEAANEIQQDYQGEFVRLNSLPKLTDTKDIAKAQLYLRNAIEEGDVGSAETMARKLGMSGTHVAQSLQVYSAWKKTTPEGALRDIYARIEAANKSNKIPEGSAKAINLSPEQQQRIVDLAKAVQELPDGTRERQVAEALLEKAKQEVIPASLLDKISLTQTMAQLLNPKTAIRNIIGNAGFFGLKNVSDTVAAGIDKGVGLVTGKRSTVLPSLKTQAIGLKEGFSKGAEDVRLGINTSPLATQFELKSGPTFSSRAGQLAEKGLAYELRVTDRAFSESAYRESLRQQMEAFAKSNGEALATPTKEMEERALIEAAQATFQDDNAVSYVFTRIKKALNLGKQFGLGDLILKYPKTPGSLIDKGIKYSPLGFIRTVLELTKPLTGKAFDQRTFVQATAQALTGSTALVGTGALLSKLGIITGEPDDDKDIAALQRLQGLGQYRLNLSALKRFVMSGFDPEAAKLQEGDTLYTYDWFQPAAIGLAIGANIDKNQGNVSTLVGQLAASIQEGANTLAEQPLVSGIANLMKFKTLPEGIMGAVASLPASFVPTAVNQANQLLDNTARDTYDPDMFKQAINQAKTKIPGLEQSLPPRVDVWGNDTERYQGDTNNLFNVLFNPGFASKYATSPESKMVLDIYNDIGETAQAPRVLPRYVMVNGKKRELTPQEYTDMQRYVGQTTQEMFNHLANDQSFQSLPKDQQAQKLGDLLTSIGQAARKAILNVDLPKNATKQSKSILNGDRTANIAKGLPDNLSTAAAAILTQVDAMTDDEKKKFLKDSANEFAYKQAEYEKDLAGGDLTEAEAFTRSLELGKLKIQTQYSPEARELYKLSKKQLKAFLKAHDIPQSVANEMAAMDQELYDSGFVSSSKYKYGLTGSKPKKAKKPKTISIPKPKFSGLSLVGDIPKTAIPGIDDIMKEYSLALSQLPGLQIKEAPVQGSDIKIAV